MEDGLMRSSFMALVGAILDIFDLFRYVLVSLS